MAFFFNPCSPCCKIPTCNMCGELSLPRSWGVSFNTDGVTDSDSLDDLETEGGVCSQFFQNLTVTFKPFIDKPCHWNGSSSRVLKTCTLGLGPTCPQLNCICDCSRCWGLLVNPIRQNGKPNNIFYAGGWIVMSNHGGSCTWTLGNGFGGNRNPFYDGSLVMKQEQPIVFTLYVNPGAFATYTTDEGGCEDEMELSFQSQTDPHGDQPLVWPEKIKAYQIGRNLQGCNGISGCLCDPCVTNWTTTISAFSIKSDWCTAAAIAVSGGGFVNITALPNQPLTGGGDITLAHQGSPCYWFGNNGHGAGTLPYPTTLYPGVEVFGFLETSVGRTIYITISLYSLQVNYGASPPHPYYGNVTQFRPYVEDISAASSDCDDYPEITFNLSSTPLQGLPGWAVQSPDAIDWPSSITLKKSEKDPIGCTPFFPLTPPITVDPGEPVNTPDSKQFTNDIKTQVDIVSKNGVITAAVACTYTNRCRNTTNPVVLNEVKNYSIAADDFNCLSPNTLQLVGSRAGIVCSNWPESLTLTP